MIDLGSIRLDLDRHRVLRPDGEESLTRLEGETLRYLLARVGEVVPRARLEVAVWGFTPGVRSEAVPVAMRRLRQKLGAGVLETVRGEGWRIARAGPRHAVTRPPTFATPFVGRAELLREVGALLEGERRLVTLRGPGGVGKTRAALQFAAGWPGEVVAVSLLGLPPDEAALAALLADALGLAHGDAAAVRRGLAARDRPLLVLDDADATAPAIAPLVGELVRTLPGVRVLVTSRVALDLPEEEMVEVRPFERVEARAFFVARLRGVHPDPEGEATALDELVEALDGLPASLELYAGRAWAGLRPLVEELRAGTQDGTLDAQVRRSWEALDAAERDVLLACSGFAGAFPADAAHAASGGRPRALAALRRRSLLQLDPGGELFLLATVRRFCGQEPRVHAARARAHAWVLARAEAACETLVRRPAEALAELRALRPHLVAIAREGAPAVAARAVLATSTALACTGPTTLRLELLEKVDWRAQPGGISERGRVDLARARRMAGVPIAELAALVGDVRSAEGALVRGDHAVASGDRVLALAEYAAAVALSAEGSVTNVLARARRSAPQSLVTLRPPEEVDADLARALDVCERHGLALPLPEVLRAAGAVWTARGDPARARASLGRALQLSDAFGLTRPVGDLWNALGMAWYEESAERACACYERAVAHAEAQGDDAYAAIFQTNLGGVLLLLDRPEEALRAADQALRVLRNRVAVQLCALLRGGALHALGRSLEAGVTLATIEPAVLGALFSPEAARHGALLVRLMEAEAALRELSAAPERSAPGLRALLADAETEAARPSASTLRAFTMRIARRLGAWGAA
ncbi:MAG: winged helix-turn-helix domain-containing protein [Myxococcota bacterium]